MNLNTLAQRVLAGNVHALELLSLEGGFYVLRAMSDTGPITLSDASGQALRLRSTTELRELLANLPPVPCTMVQQVVHDEMCGQSDGPAAPLRMPLTLASQW
ncbi:MULTISPECIES: DUF6482 family protein [Pseudomonas]|uniref:Metal ABC transporter ATPase n=1 Tax=Pseudomonas putida TaxID=303 RepID=A0A1B2F436_PSEPU|nr:MULTISPECIES: DUF6482 family protein [Pseudomonas]ANY87039.1 hypothetical protein IEC33019_1471 [Pseudomonas putida]MCL8304381.1 DUF6482 family protein [Pseudomonas putida]